MRQGETFLSGGSEAALFLIGQNRRGQWVVQDQRGRRGGLFISRAAALKYALFENGNRPQLVVTIAGYRKFAHGTVLPTAVNALSADPGMPGIGGT